MIAAYTVVFSWLSIQKYRFYLYDGFDLAIFAQATSGILRGAMYSSLRGMNWLGDHTSLILFVIAPLYALFHHPVTLLILQSAAIGLGAIPTFLLARRCLVPSGAALLCAAMYLLHPATAYLNLFEFHPETIATPLLLMALDSLIAGRPGRMTLCVAVALLAKEDVALVIGALGAYALLSRQPHRGRYAALILGMAALSLVASYAVVKPLLNQGRGDFALMYPDWGRSPVEIARTVVTHPVRTLAWLAGTPGDSADSLVKRTTYLQMLAPLAFLPILSPATLLIASPILVELFLFRGLEQHTIYYQYAALTLPVLVGAAVIGLGNVLRWIRVRDVKALATAGRSRCVGLCISGGAVLAAIVSQLLFGPFAIPRRPPAVAIQPSIAGPLDRELRPTRDRFVERSQSRRGVVASFEFLPRFTENTELHSLHHILCGHYTISRLPYPLPHGIEAMLFEDDPERTLSSVDLGTGQRLRDVIAHNGLRLIENVGSLSLYLRASPAGADSVETWSTGPFAIPKAKRVGVDGQLEYLGASPPLSVAAPGSVLPVQTYWRRLKAVDRVFLALYVLLDDKGVPILQQTSFVGALNNPAHLWPVDAVTRTTYRLRLPGGVKPGQYTLALRIGEWDGHSSRLAECDAPDVIANRGLITIGQVRIAGPVLARPRP